VINSIDAILNDTGAALLIFAASAAIASIFVKSPFVRFAAGAAGVLVALVVGVSTRSLFTWLVSTIERPSFPGFVLFFALAVSAVSGWRIDRSAEFRFATGIFAVAGCALCPAATGFLNADTYPYGYGGYLLPAGVAAVIAYALFRGYLISALALNIAIASFLLDLGASRNLWDYIIDPIAWIIGCSTWVVFGVLSISARLNRAAVAPVQPSSGIGETPISH
jgi:hypothetical protein